MEYRENPLYGKTIVFDGDSICQGNTEKGREPWAPYVGKRNSMQWFNYGVGGGTITAEVYVESTGAKRHWVCRSIDAIHEKHPDLDYLILEGGTNDADLFVSSHERLGSYISEDFSGNYDDTTFAGALETLFFKATSYYPNTRIGFIIAHKMSGINGSYVPAARRRKYFVLAIEICKKWGIPVLDLWENSPLNASLKCYYDPTISYDENEAQGKAYIDGQHLSAKGYAMINPMIEKLHRISLTKPPKI